MIPVFTDMSMDARNFFVERVEKRLTNKKPRRCFATDWSRSRRRKDPDRKPQNRPWS